jgi:hypothetical protein
MEQRKDGTKMLMDINGIPASWGVQLYQDLYVRVGPITA